MTACPYKLQLLTLTVDEQPVWVELHMDITKARTELGFNPRDTETAIRETFKLLVSRK